MDKIVIEDLKIYAYHGVFDEEKKNGQFFYVNAILDTDFSLAASKDEIELATNYATVCECINRIVTEEKCNLIETVAYRVAEGILTEFELIKSVDIEIRKPSAPVNMEFESISVKHSLGWNKAYISYGSNMGDSRKLITDALAELNMRKDCRIIKNSSLIVTKPYGGVKQDDFLNGACVIETFLNPHELLDVLHEVEQKAGRERTIHWGPRTLDLDIIFYEDVVMQSDDLIIPHIDAHNREFVLKPLSEIASYKIHPVYNKSVAELYSELLAQ